MSTSLVINFEKHINKYPVWVPQCFQLIQIMKNYVQIKKNLCSRLYKKEKKIFLDNLNTRCVTDNKLFWKTMKPFFSSRNNHGTNTKLVEYDKILNDGENLWKK